MNLRITSDSNWEARVSEATDELDNRSFEEFFEPRVYGPGLDELFIVLMCRDPEHGFKQRINYYKKDKLISMDVMLNLPDMVESDTAGRIRLVAEALYDEIPRVVRKYKFKDEEFDTDRFVAEWEAWFDRTKWLKWNGE